MLTSSRLFCRSISLSSRSAAVRLHTSAVRGENVGSPWEEQFSAAKEKLAKLKEKPRKDAKVRLYALSQQATKGKCDTIKPNALDFSKNAEWDAWKALENMPQEEAKKRFVELVNSVAGKDRNKARRNPKRRTITMTATLQAPVQEDWDDSLDVTSAGNVVYIRLNRPAHKNALSLQMYDDIALTLENAAEDQDISVVVLTGTGDYFSSGNDLTNFTNVEPENVVGQIREIHEIVKNFVQSFIDFPKPLIGLVNGPAVGIAVAVLGLVDVVYCTDKATFNTPFSQLGQGPVGCASYTFPRMMGTAKANELLLFNKMLTAQDALDKNLVTQVFPDQIFHEETEALVANYASLPAQCLRETKMLLRKAERDLLVQVNEAECEVLLNRWQTKESWDAVMAVVNKKMEKKKDKKEPDSE